jgi:hypothetical protein
MVSSTAENVSGASTPLAPEGLLGIFTAVTVVIGNQPFGGASFGFLV